MHYYAALLGCIKARTIVIILAGWRSLFGELHRFPTMGADDDQKIGAVPPPRKGGIYASMF